MTKNWIHSGNLQQEPSEREIRHRALAGKAAAEGIVLLKNDGVLPLKLSDPIALFGSGADKTVKGGIGSGDVNNRENISIFRGVREAGAAVTSLEWLKDYDRRYDDAREKWKEKILEDAHHVDNPFDAYAANPFVLPEGRSITEKDLKGACAALYVISRISGEGKDRRLAEGDYYLSRREWEDIRYLDQYGIPLILILNAGGPVELTDILREADNIRAVLNISQPGQEGGTAVADILFGKAVPEGKLTATWAERYEDYPCADSFSYLNGNLEKEEYREGIYVGYRYFDSFGVKPLFPFGHGLSYTSFEMKFHEIKAKENASEEIQRLKSKGFLSEAESEGVELEKIEKFFSGNLAKRIFSSDLFMREYKFVTEVSAGEYNPELPENLKDEKIVIQGIADCVFSENGEAVLVDYKTDRVSTPKKLIELYRNQLKVYKQAIEKSLEIPVKEVLLYSFHLGEEIEVNI